MESKHIMILAGVGCVMLGAIEITALFMGVDGLYLSGVVGAISAIVAGACGFSIGTVKAATKTE